VRDDEGGATGLPLPGAGVGTGRGGGDEYRPYAQRHAVEGRQHEQVVQAEIAEPGGLPEGKVGVVLIGSVTRTNCGSPNIS
jgi:hypothetical protein